MWSFKQKEKERAGRTHITSGMLQKKCGALCYCSKNVSLSLQTGWTNWRLNASCFLIINVSVCQFSPGGKLSERFHVLSNLHIFVEGIPREYTELRTLVLIILWPAIHSYTKSLYDFMLFVVKCRSGLKICEEEGPIE